MAFAACSSTYITGGELFCRRWAVPKETPPPKLRGDIIASYAFHGYLCVTRKNHLFPDKVLQMFPFCKEKCLEPVRMNLQSLGKSNCEGWCLQKQYRLLSKAVATMEPYCLIPSESGLINDSSLWFDSNSDSEVESSDDCPELVERERLRRIRISKANKGNIPWNKGKKHSPETLQRIRERTKLAMQDPKVRMKLINLGHAQSDETKNKIAIGVRRGWDRRRGILMIQESCLFEWQNIIAESSRKGYGGEVELQWDSHKVMDEELKQVWLESIEKRKSIPRPKGSRRAPKSLEQRRKISEAISAKWTDPEYRDRVQAAMSKYHGIGAERKVRRKSTSGAFPKRKVSIKKESEITAQLNSGLKNIKQLTYNKKKNSAPSFKDPMSSAKLELLKKIKAERAEIEAKKREAIMRAKLLIAEAERAAEALEVAALKSPLAKASLLETRRLIAEATLSIQSIENGHLISQESVVESAKSQQLVNGFHTFSSAESIVEINQHKMRHGVNCSETSLPSLFNNERIEPRSAESAVHDTSDSVSRKPEESVVGAARTKKWVCGRFVEVED